MNMVRSNSFNSNNSNNSGGAVTPPAVGTPNLHQKGMQRQHSAPAHQTTPTKSHVQMSPASLRSPVRSHTGQHVSSSPSTPSRSNSLPNAQPKKLIPVSNGLKGEVSYSKTRWEENVHILPIHFHSLLHL